MMLNLDEKIFIGKGNFEEVISEFSEGGWRVFRLPDKIVSKKDFFDGIRLIFPLDPYLDGERSWDALDDSLWGGIDGLKEKKVLIIWENHELLKVNDFDSYFIARSILDELRKTFSSLDLTIGNPKKILVIYSS